MNKKVLQIMNSVAQTLHKKNLIKSQEKIILTVSGGQDSICLLFIFYLLRKELLIDFDLIWCNHFWQTSSFFTMLHVAKCNFCCSSTILFFLPLKKVVSERSARDWRYKVIQRTALFYGSTTTAQAHTKSDRSETILFNLIRGTGLAGIATLPLHSTRSFFSYNRFYPIVKLCLTTVSKNPIVELSASYEGKHVHLHSSIDFVDATTRVEAKTTIQYKHVFNFSNPHAMGITRDVLSTFREIRNIEFLFQFFHYQNSKNRFCFFSILDSRISYRCLYTGFNPMRFLLIKTAYNTKLLGLLNQKQMDLLCIYQVNATSKSNAFAFATNVATSVLVRGFTSDISVGGDSVHLQSRCHHKVYLRVPGSTQYKDVIKNQLYIPNCHNFFNQLKVFY